MDKLIEDINNYRLSLADKLSKHAILRREMHKFNRYMNTTLTPTPEEDEYVVDRLEEIIQQDDNLWDSYQTEMLVHQQCNDQDNGWKIPEPKLQINHMLVLLSKILN